MNSVLRIFLVAMGAWGASVAVSFLLIALAAVTTQKWTSSRMEPVVWILLLVIVILFSLGIVFVHVNGKRILAGQGSVWVYTIIYGIVVLFTQLMVGIVALAALNR